jgi:hypothetical protein
MASEGATCLPTHGAPADLQAGKLAGHHLCQPWLQQHLQHRTAPVKHAAVRSTSGAGSTLTGASTRGIRIHGSRQWIRTGSLPVLAPCSRSTHCPLTKRCSDVQHLAAAALPLPGASRTGHPLKVHFPGMRSPAPSSRSSALREAGSGPSRRPLPNLPSLAAGASPHVPRASRALQPRAPGNPRLGGQGLGQPTLAMSAHCRGSPAGTPAAQPPLLLALLSTMRYDYTRGDCSCGSEGDWRDARQRPTMSGGARARQGECQQSQRRQAFAYNPSTTHVTR